MPFRALAAGPVTITAAFHGTTATLVAIDDRRSATSVGGFPAAARTVTVIYSGDANYLPVTITIATPVAKRRSAAATSSSR